MRVGLRGKGAPALQEMKNSAADAVHVALVHATHAPAGRHTAKRGDTRYHWPVPCRTCSGIAVQPLSMILRRCWLFGRHGCCAYDTRIHEA